MLSGSMVPTAYAGGFLLACAVPGWQTALAVMVALVLLTTGAAVGMSHDLSNRLVEVAYFALAGAWVGLLARSATIVLRAKDELFWAILLVGFVAIPIVVLAMFATKGN